MEDEKNRDKDVELHKMEYYKDSNKKRGESTFRFNCLILHKIFSQSPEIQRLNLHKIIGISDFQHCKFLEFHRNTVTPIMKTIRTQVCP